MCALTVLSSMAATEAHPVRVRSVKAHSCQVIIRVWYVNSSGVFRKKKKKCTGFIPQQLTLWVFLPLLARVRSVHKLCYHGDPLRVLLQNVLGRNRWQEDVWGSLVPLMCFQWLNCQMQRACLGFCHACQLFLQCFQCAFTAEENGKSFEWIKESVRDVLSMFEKSGNQTLGNSLSVLL